MRLPSLLFLLALATFVPSAALGGPNLSGTRLQRFVDARLARGESVIRIPPGRYEVTPEDGVHLVIRGARDVTIDATGVEMVCTETTLAIHLSFCENVTIVGLTIDYDPLPFTQGRIVEIGEDRKSHVIEIMDGFPPASEAYVFKHSIYTPEGELRFGNYYTYQLEVLGPRRLRVHGLNPRVDGGEQVGDVVIVSTQHLSGRYRPHAVFVDNSTGTRLEDVRLYSSPCFGFFEVDSSGSVYERCVIDRREGRFHSLNADAFHSKYAEVGPQIIGCHAMWQGDDCVNICGEYHLVTDIAGKRLRVLAMDRLHVEPGDALQVVTADGRRLEDVVAVGVERLGEVNDADKAFVESLRIHPNKKRVRGAFAVTIDRVLDLPRGSVIASEHRMGSGFVVRDNVFGNNRSRGILVKASHGEISGNRLVNTHMQSILVAPEYFWLESGFGTGLRVFGNEILGPRAEAIAVKGIGPHPGHQDLEVRDNRIRTSVAPAIRVESVRGGIVADNEILTPAGEPLVDSMVARHNDALELRQ